MATTLEQQQRLQSEICEVEKLQGRQRQEIFEVEDKIANKRDELIAALEQKLQQTCLLFVGKWFKN